MNKRTALLTALTLLVGYAVVLSVALVLPGCGKSDEELIRESVVEVMDSFKKPTEEILKKYVDGNEESLAQYEQYGIDIYEFLGHCFSHFDYTINDVKVEGDSATADLTLSNANLETAFAEAASEFYDNVDDYGKILEGDNVEQELAKVLVQKIYDKLDTAQDMVNSDVTLRLKKVDGEWDIDEDSMDEVISGMYGGAKL